MKRILAFLLVAVMTASVFAGCANTGNAVSNGVSESTTSTSETKPQIPSAALSKQTNLKSKTSLKSPYVIIPSAVSLLGVILVLIKRRLF